MTARERLVIQLKPLYSINSMTSQACDQGHGVELLGEKAATRQLEEHSTLLLV
jgi:hypothetical protein